MYSYIYMYRVYPKRSLGGDVFWLSLRRIGDERVNKAAPRLKLVRHTNICIF